MTECFGGRHIYSTFYDRLYNYQFSKITLFIIFSGDKSPPKLEPSDALPLPSNSETNSEPPTLKPVELNPEQSKLFKRVTFDNESHSACPQSVLVIGHPPEPTLASSGHAPAAAASAVAEPSSDVNRRTSVLFCKPQSVSPPKSAKNAETQPASPQLGTKTLLSVVLPRLETLLQPRKRSRSTCGDSEVEEGSPGKRLDTGKRTGARRPAFPRGVSGRSVGGGACRLWRGARPPRFLWAPVRRPGFSRPGARCRSEVAPPGAGLARGSRCPFSGASGPRGAWPCRAPWGAGGPPCSGVARPGLSAASRARGGRWGVCSRPRSPAGTTRERVCP